jgi:hypothetical protein
MYSGEILLLFLPSGLAAPSPCAGLPARARR